MSFNECMRKRLGWLTWIFGGGAAATAFIGALLLGGLSFGVAFLIALAVLGVVFALAVLVCWLSNRK